MPRSTLAADFAASMDHCLAQGAPWPAAIAVSGGGDSLALMHLLEEWAREAKRPAGTVLTVDHGLLPQAGKIAASVIASARRLGLEAHKLDWQGAKPKADLEAEARAARYRLMGNWCAAHGLHALYVAHTQDDQAETFILRLARGSGLDGLAAMRPVSPYPFPGLERLTLVRPLLAMRRAVLRQFLARRRIDCVEDPMNRDTRFARVRVREALPSLEALGLSVPRLAATAAHLARAREALEAATRDFMSEACRFGPDNILLDATRLGSVPAEIGLRALAHILSRLSGATYRPRFERLERLYRLIAAGELHSARTLQGCRIGPARDATAVFGAGTIVLTREPQRKKAKIQRVAARNQIS